MKGITVLALLAALFPIAAQSQTANAPAATPEFTWSGFYAGVNLGVDEQRTQPNSAAQTYIFEGSSTTDPEESISSANSGAVVGGIQIGYDHQFSKLVAGFQASSDWTSNSGYGNYNADYEPTEIVSARTNWLGSFTGRVGYALRPKSLAYVKAGLALRANHYTDGDPTYPFSTSGSAMGVGWLVGGGFEQAIKSHWSVFGEFDYSGFGTKNVGLSSSSDGGSAWVDSFQTNAYQGLVGINYRFGSR